MTKSPSGEAYIRWLERQMRRRARIKSLHQKGISLAEIGRRLKISRERVRQVVKRATP